MAAEIYYCYFYSRLLPLTQSQLTHGSQLVFLSSSDMEPPSSGDRTTVQHLEQFFIVLQVRFQNHNHYFINTGNSNNESPTHRVFPSTICQISDISFLHTEHDEVQKNKTDFRQCVSNHKACPWLNVYDQIYSLNAQNEVKQ